AQPAVCPAFLRVDAALLGEEAGELRIARRGLRARSFGRASDRKAAAARDREVDEAALELRHTYLAAEVGGLGQAKAYFAVLAPGPAQESFLVRSQAPHGEAFKADAPFGALLPAPGDQRLESLRRHQQHELARGPRGRLQQRRWRLCLAQCAGERLEPQRDAVESSEQALSAH